MRRRSPWWQALPGPIPTAVCCVPRRSRLSSGLPTRPRDLSLASRRTTCTWRRVTVRWSPSPTPGVLPERVVLDAIYALPQLRGHGLGTALLTALLATLPPLPMTADVVAGNRKGEVFYERRGFVPRETLQVDLLGEAVVERRWWRDRSEPGPSR